VLILVRHGRTANNALGLLQGRTDPALDDVGEHQAAALGRELAGVLAGGARLVSSPLVRARATAQAIAADGGEDRAVDVDERWVELDYGEFDGRPVRDVGADVWAHWRRDLTFAPPAGESLLTLFERVTGACEELLGEIAERDVVVVSHVSPIKAAVGWALGAGAGLSWRCHLDQAAITRIGIGTDARPVLRSFNETAHLRADPIVPAPLQQPLRIEG
jgi:alpha-ribazole phosphatase